MTTRDAVVKQVTNYALDYYRNEFMDGLAWKPLTLSAYDPDGQTFKANLPDLPEFILPVSQSHARNFKDNAGQIKFKNPKFTLVKGNWVLTAVSALTRQMGTQQTITTARRLPTTRQPNYLLISMP